MHTWKKFLKLQDKRLREQKRSLELNINHPLIHKIKSIFETDTTNPILKDYSELLFDLAVISEGGKIEDPAHFNKLLADMMLKAI